MPWLEENYSLPEDWRTLDEYKFLQSVATYLSEQAAIELSTDESVEIQGETSVEDLDGEEIYLDVPLDREDFSSAIDELVMKAIETARATIEKSGLAAEDIDKTTFIGGARG